MPNCLGFRAFQSFGLPCFLCVHLLFTHYGLLYISLSILHWPFKNLFNECNLGIYQNSRQIKNFKKTMKRLNNFWKQSMFTTLFWLSLNSLNLSEGWDTSQMIQKYPTQCRNFLENKGPDNLKVFQTFLKVSTQSRNFKDNPGTFQTLWKIGKAYSTALWSLQIVGCVLY